MIHKMSLKIVLMRQQKEVDDPYCEILKSLGCVQCIPTLSFEFFNIDQLKDCMYAHEKWSGIIFTSKQSIEAVKESLDEKTLLEWKKKRCYVVGDATYEAATSIGFSCVGKECGSATELTKVLGQLCDGSKILPLLFVCGQLRRDTIPNFLENNKIPYQTVVVYKTIAHRNLTELIHEYVNVSVCPSHIVYFSPSGYKYAHYVWKNLLENKINEIVFVAIGKTTATEMNQSLHKVKVAAKPNPSSVYEAIKNK